MLCALPAAVFLVSGIYLANIISWREPRLELVFLFSVLMAVLYGAAFISRRLGECFLKLIISFPLSYLCLQYFWKTEYMLRSLNWVYPGYGHLSGVGKSAAGLLIIVYFILCIIALICAFGLSTIIEENNKAIRFEKPQLIVCGILGIATVAVVIILERQFPPTAVFAG